MVRKLFILFEILLFSTFVNFAVGSLSSPPTEPSYCPCGFEEYRGYPFPFLKRDPVIDPDAPPALVRACDCPPGIPYQKPDILLSFFVVNEIAYFLVGLILYGVFWMGIRIRKKYRTSSIKK